MRALVISALGIASLLHGPACGHVSAVMQDQAQSVVLATALEPVSLTNNAQAVQLTPAPRWRAGALDQRLQDLRQGERLFVVLRGKHAVAAPGALFRIHVGGPAVGREGASSIGLVSFYGARPKPLAPSGDTDDAFDSFEVTDWVSDPARRAALSSLRLTIEPIGPVESGAQPSIESIELVLQR